MTDGHAASRCRREGALRRAGQDRQARARSGCSRARRRVECGRGSATFIVKPKAESPAHRDAGARVRHAGARLGADRDRSRRGSRPTARCSATRSADSLRKHAPFVVTFATPAFCASRTCGPVVDIVDHVRKRLEKRGSPLHPRGDLQAQRAGEGRQPLGAPVEPAQRAMDVPRRPRRPDQGQVRGRAVGGRAQQAMRRTLLQ